MQLKYPTCCSAYLNFDGQLFVGGQCIVIGQRQQADLIQSIRGIGNQLPEEDLKNKRDSMSDGNGFLTMSEAGQGWTTRA